jgi:hypothetical protein
LRKFAESNSLTGGGMGNEPSILEWTCFNPTGMRWVKPEFGLGIIFEERQGDKGVRGRAAARLCLSRLTDGRETDPAKDLRGAPTSPHGYLSLSHTRGAAAAAFDPARPVGIDVEKIVPGRVTEVYQKFMSDDERQRFETTNDAAFFFSVWSVKEAMFKIVNRYMDEVSFRKELRVDAEFYVSGKGKGFCVRPGFEMEMELWRTFVDDYVFCGAALVGVP